MRLLFLAAFALFPFSLIAAAADTPPDLGGGQIGAAHRIAARGEEGQYQLSAADGSRYSVTVVLSTHDKAYVSLVDSQFTMQRIYLYTDFDAERNAYRLAEEFDITEGKVIIAGYLTINDDKTASLQLIFANEELRMLKGARKDTFPALPRETVPLSCSEAYTGEIGLIDGSALKGELTIYPSGSQLMALFRSENGAIRRQFRSGDQNGQIYLTSLAGRRYSFLHLRLIRSSSGDVSGYAVVAGHGRSVRPSIFRRKLRENGGTCSGSRR